MWEGEEKKKNGFIKLYLSLFRRGELICVYSVLTSQSFKECPFNLLQRHGGSCQRSFDGQSFLERQVKCGLGGGCPV